jgi:predicted alpha/beta-hydrolase family hydrolase
MPRLVRSLLAAVGLVALVAAAGCAEERTAPPPEPNASESASASPGVTLPPIGADCRDQALQGLTLRLVNAAGLSISAVDLGSGPLGVVLAHQSDASLCQWMPYAQVLASRGYRVLAFDFAGYGSSSQPRQKTYVEDLRTAVAYLRDRGTTHVVIIGASMGATMSVVAAAAITPPVDGVIALSPPVTFDGVNAEKAAPSLKSPALYVAGETDGDYEVYAKSINDATPADLRDLLVVPAPQHGIQFVSSDTSAGSQVRAAIEAFLLAHLRVTPSPSSTPR